MADVYVQIDGPSTRYSNAIEVAAGTSFGLGHLANAMHLIRPDLGGSRATQAHVVGDDVRILTSGWRMPGRLPTGGTYPRPVKRIAATFTPDHFSADIEFAAKDFTPDPHAAWTGDKPTLDEDGTVTVPSLAPDVPDGGVLCLIQYQFDDLRPQWSHVIPDIADLFLWLPNLLGEREPVYGQQDVTSTTATGPYDFPLVNNLGNSLWMDHAIWDPNLTTRVPLGVPLQVSFYATDIHEIWTRGEINEHGYPSLLYGTKPHDTNMYDVSTHQPRWSYPWTINGQITSLPADPPPPTYLFGG